MSLMVPGDLTSRIERSVLSAFEDLDAPGAPPRLVKAMRYAVFPGGARMRPRLLLSVALACGDKHPRAADGAAAALELLHCASLVHDDLPAFDDALLRRGQESVHRAFGQQIAILAGDALIVRAFETLASGARDATALLPELLQVMGRAVGAPSGIVAGQAWESETEIDLRAYHRAKTGALFEAAVRAGALTGGGIPADWAALGTAFGEAYQVADDIADVQARPEHLGKETGQDAAKGRPNVALELGVQGASERLVGLLREAMGSLPSCPQRTEIQRWIAGSIDHFLPEALAAPSRAALLDAAASGL